MKNLLNLVSFIFGLAGVVLLWCNGLQHRVAINGGTASTDFEAEQRAADRKNRWANVGAALAVLGLVAQYACSLMP